MAEVGMKERRELLKVLWRCCRCQFVDRRPRITPGICELCKGNESEPVVR